VSTGGAGECLCAAAGLGGWKGGPSGHPLPAMRLPLARPAILMLMRLRAHCKNNSGKIGTAQIA